MRSTLTEPYANDPTALSSALLTISTTPDAPASENTPNSTFVPFVDVQSIVLCRAPASNVTRRHSFLSPTDEDYFLTVTLDSSLASSPPPRFIYNDNLQHSPSPYDNDSDYSYINTPYSADGFDILLARTGLTHQFPELSYKLRNGFPISHNLSPLITSYTPNNLPGADLFKQVCDDYISEELAKGRYSGPFSHDQLFAKIGHFRSSPLQVVVKAGADGVPDKYRVCRHLSYAGSMGYSVNDEIDSESYPTEWGTAAEFADIVRRSTFLLSFVPLSCRFGRSLRHLTRLRSRSFLV